MASDRSEEAPGKVASAQQQIEDDHRILAETLDRLESTEDLEASLHLLEELRNLLLPHFAREEAEDGFPQLVQDEASHLIERLEHILGEHQRILDAVDRLLEEGRSTLEGPIKSHFRDCRTLIDLLRQHEREETRLVTDALYQDIGGG